MLFFYANELHKNTKLSGLVFFCSYFCCFEVYFVVIYFVFSLYSVCLPSCVTTSIPISQSCDVYSELLPVPLSSVVSILLISPCPFNLIGLALCMFLCHGSPVLRFSSMSSHVIFCKLLLPCQNFLLSKFKFFVFCLHELFVSFCFPGPCLHKPWHFTAHTHNREFYF